MGCVDEATTSALRVASCGRSHLAEKALEVGAAPALGSQAVQVTPWPGTCTPVIASKTESGGKPEKKEDFLFSRSLWSPPSLCFCILNVYVLAFSCNFKSRILEPEQLGSDLGPPLG